MRIGDIVICLKTIEIDNSKIGLCCGKYKKDEKYLVSNVIDDFAIICCDGGYNVFSVNTKYFETIHQRRIRLIEEFIHI